MAQLEKHAGRIVFSDRIADMIMIISGMTCSPYTRLFPAARQGYSGGPL